MTPFTLTWVLAILVIGEINASTIFRRDQLPEVSINSNTGTRLRPFVNPALTYFGGPIVENIEVFPIFYATRRQRFSFKPKASLIVQFYTAIVDSLYLDWLSEYSVLSKRIGRGRFIDYLVGYNRVNTFSLNETAIENYLTTLADSQLIQPNPNRYFPIHFAPGYSITFRGYKSCEIFCAYHGAVNWKEKKIYYGVIPDQSGGCATGCGSGNTTIDNYFELSSDVLVRTITDPAGPLAKSFEAPLGWYDANNYVEIGGLCIGQQTIVGGDNRAYAVKEQWSNRCKKCIVKYNTTSCPPISPF
ncbi:hypothetical protein BJ742DRAFT_805029 [Cladochytrium replicatum]|nr:hypothetical protein BJ742DRAFT_805029 [Cladochytrium replicatum]